MDSEIEDQNDSQPLLQYNYSDSKSKIYQFVMYFKLTSKRNMIMRSAKATARIEGFKRKHAELKLALQSAGLDVDLIWESDDHMKYHWGITASEERMRIHADRLHYELQLLPAYGGGTAPFYAKHTRLFENPNTGSVFSDLDKQRIVLSIIQSDEAIGGANVKIPELFRNKQIYKFYPLHDEQTQEWLQREWVKKPWRRQPINKVRDYFGEKVAFYFGFMGYCIKWLFPASLVGIIILIIQSVKSLRQYAFIGSAVFSIFMPLWAILFIEFWKRKSIARAVKWGMDKLEIKEETRPTYTGFEKVGVWWGSEWIDLSELSKKDKNFHRLNIYESHSTRIKRAILFSWPILLLMVLISTGIAFGFIVLNALVAEKAQLRTGISILNGLVIVILSIIYRKVAYYLTERENHRTETDAEDSLIIKVFVFDFINAFGTIFYQAFLRYNITWKSLPWMNGGVCRAPGLDTASKFSCVLYEISVLLISIFIVRIVVFQALDFLIPLLYTKISLCCTKTRFKHKKPTASQLQGKMAPFGGTMDEYSGMVIQFGYVTMFAAALPIGPAIAMLSFLMEIRTDGYKMLRLWKRAPAQPARDIGIYQSIIEFIGYVSIVTNCALIGFADSPSSADLAFRLSLIILCENSVLAAKFFLSKIIPKVPESVRQVLARRSFIKEELSGQDLASKIPKIRESAQYAPLDPDTSEGSQNYPGSQSQSVPGSRNGSIVSFQPISPSNMPKEGDFISFEPDPIESSSDEDEDYSETFEESSLLNESDPRRYDLV